MTPNCVVDSLILGSDISFTFIIFFLSLSEDNIRQSDKHSLFSGLTLKWHQTNSMDVGWGERERESLVINLMRESLMMDECSAVSVPFGTRERVALHECVLCLWNCHTMLIQASSLVLTRMSCVLYFFHIQCWLSKSNEESIYKVVNSTHSKNNVEAKIVRHIQDFNSDSICVSCVTCVNKW